MKYVWKLAKVEGKQNTINMIDMTQEQLQNASKLCNNMLHNTDPITLGQLNVLKEIEAQYKNILATTAVSYITSINKDENGGIYTVPSLIKLLSSFNDSENVILIKDLFPDLKNEFNYINIQSVLDACLEKLPLFDKKFINKNLYQKTGIWLTKDERAKFTDMNILSRQNIVDYIRKELKLDKSFPILVKTKGFSYDQFKTILKIKNKCSYALFTIDELLLLGFKVYPILIKNTKNNIKRWAELEQQLNETLESNFGISKK